LDSDVGDEEGKVSVERLDGWGRDIKRKEVGVVVWGRCRRDEFWTRLAVEFLEGGKAFFSSFPSW
jgi:hypothetical protein